MPDIIYRYKSKNTGRYVYLNEDQLGQYPDAIIYMTTPDGSKADLGTVRSLGMAYGDYEPDLTTEQRFNRLGIFFNEDTKMWQNGDGRIKISTPRTTTQRVSTSSEPTYEQRLIAIGYGLNPQTGRLEAPRLTNVAKRRVISDANNPVATPDLTQVAAAREIIDSELNGVGPYGGKITEEESVQTLMPDTPAAVQSALDTANSTPRPYIFDSPETRIVDPATGVNLLDVPDTSAAIQASEENLNTIKQQTSLPEGRVEDVIIGSVREYDPALDLPLETVVRPNPHLSEPVVDDSTQLTSQNIIQRPGESIASAISPASVNATTLVDSNQSVYDLGEVLSGQTVPGAKGKYVYYKNYPNLRGYAYANLEGLNPEFATRLGNFSNWYKENIGREFYGSSGYRDAEHQGKVRATQGKAAAKPGYSYHGSGTAFDADWITALSATKKAIRNNPNLLTDYNVSNEAELLDKALAQYGLERNMKDNPKEQHHIQAIEDDAWMKAVNTELLLEHYKNGLLGTQLGSYYMRGRI